MVQQQWYNVEDGFAQCERQQQWFRKRLRGVATLLKGCAQIGADAFAKFEFRANSSR